MKKKIKRIKVIQVTQHDIDNGIPEESESCPIARAIARSFHKKIGYVKVMGEDFQFPTEECIRAPKSVETFVKKFDHFEKVKPFQFKLEY